MNDYFGKRERDVIYTELGIVFLQRGEDGEWYEVGAAPTGEIGEMAAMYFLTWHMPTPEEIEYELNRYDGHQLADIQERLVTGIIVSLVYGGVMKFSTTNRLRTYAVEPRVMVGCAKYKRIADRIIPVLASNQEMPV